jgi:hypothetical protein
MTSRTARSNEQSELLSRVDHRCCIIHRRPSK